MATLSNSVQEKINRSLFIAQEAPTYSAIHHPDRFLDDLTCLDEENPAKLRREDEFIGSHYDSYVLERFFFIHIRGSFKQVIGWQDGFLNGDCVQIKVNDVGHFAELVEAKIKPVRQRAEQVGLKVELYPLDAYGNVTFNLSTKKVGTERNGWLMAEQSVLDRTLVTVRDSQERLEFNRLVEFIGRNVEIDFRPRITHKIGKIIIALEAIEMIIF